MNSKSPEIARRAYGEACNIALTLDLVGERWTLLVLRELFTGSGTFSDMQDSLPGMAPNLLTARLRQLEDDGLVAQEKAPGMRNRRIYRLTERGRALEPLLVEMVRFGIAARLTAAPDDFFRPGWVVLSAKAAFRRDRAAGMSETYEFRAGDEVFYLGVRDGEPNHGVGPAPAPAVVAEMSKETFDRFQSGRLEPAAGVASGAIRIVSGHAAALQRCDFIYSS
jgi:DNA-binding HxlR family transcriptional regulator